MHVGSVVLDEMARRRWVCGGWYSSDADTVTGCEPSWIRPAGSSEAPLYGIYGTKAEGQDLQCSLGRDQAGSPLQPQTTWTQTGREQSNHRETTPCRRPVTFLCGARRDENYTSGAVKNSQDSLRSRPLAFQGFSKIVNVFLPPWFSYLGGQWRLKKSLFLFFLYQYTVLLEHPSLGMIEFVAFSGVSRVFPVVSFWLKKKKLSEATSFIKSLTRGLFGAASWSNHSIHLYTRMSGSQRLRCRSGGSPEPAAMPCGSCSQV